MIMECNRTGDHKVLPVFYDVDPTDVRKQTGSFKDAFDKHEERFMNDINKVKRWREALRETAELVGMPLQNQANGHEAQFIKYIVKKLEKKVGSRHAVLSVAPFTTGSDSIVNDINCWLQDGSNDVSVGMIHGMGGIGKTNIAKIAYNINHKNFEGSSFVADVKAAKKDKHLVRLQKQVCSDILKKTDVIINNCAEGNSKIQQAVCSKKILLVLDNVDDLKQVDAIMGMRNWFHPGSKILITTRNIRSVNGHDKIFNVELLDGDKSLQLFSLHAFGQYDPIKCFNELSKRVVSHCGGLPLALEVLGRSFYDRSIEEWKDLLGELGEKSNIVEILTVLEISYDSLQESHIKDLFLDIACFFVGYKKDYIITIYENANIGIQKLIDRCLISVDYISNRLTMHQLLQDMGRNVVFKESQKDLGERSRLWNHKDASFVMETMTGTKRITGIILNENVTNSMLLEDLSTDGFTEMHNLRFLSINNVRKLIGDYEKFPRGIKWLCCHGFSLEFLPPNRYLKQLVFLDMRKSKLKHLQKESMDRPKLKFLNLSHSHDLIYISDLSKLTSLETLILKDCISLVEVHKSIAHLPRLTSLNLGGCKKLGKLERQISTFGPSTFLTSTLVSLTLRKCNLTSFTSASSKLSMLRKLDLNGNPILIFSGADNMNSLRVLFMLDCTSLQSLHCLPSSLDCVSVQGCKSLKSLTFNNDHTNHISSEGSSELLDVFKLAPIGNIDPDIKNSFGLPSLESICSTKVKMFNAYIWNLLASKLPLQVLYEEGVYSIYLPAGDVREYFRWKLNGSETWLNAPLLPGFGTLSKEPALAHKK